MGEVHDVALLLVGAWLFFYRLPLQTKSFGAIAEALTTACCGLSLALLAQLLPWPPPGFRAVLLAVLGVLFAFCHPAFTAIVVTVPLGIAFGALMWQCGLCSAVPDMHVLILSVTSLVFVAVFVCTPGIAGVLSLRLVLVPALSALLLTTALAGLVPSLGALAPRALLVASPCAADSGNRQSPLLSFAYWLLVAACAVGLQVLLAWRARRSGGKGDRAPGGARGGLAASLLPSADADSGEEDGFQRPEDMKNDRFQMLVKAIYADKDADLSHLTENEQKIVAVCREDEFERDRLLWGGGLI
mmetsp:Transcript_11278/g.31741  ORF Transcript_11278/g.31741 Transcript_11278/m.31741 type:complete len:301 (+) Transcript_11278:53-955(+)